MLKNLQIFAVISVLFLVLSCCKAENNQGESESNMPKRDSEKTEEAEAGDENINESSKNNDAAISFSFPDDDTDNLIKDDERDDILKRAEQLLQERN